VNWIVHESHQTRISDSSLYDEVCKLCGATDGRGDERLRHPCPAAPQAPNESGAACMPPLPDRSELFEAARAAAAKVAALPPVERALLHADQRASMARGLLSEECDSLAANAAIDADPLSVLAAEVCRLRGDGAGPPFHFDRWIDGERMAEDVEITLAPTLAMAMGAAVRLCPRRAGQVAVLVYRPRALLAGEAELREQIVQLGRDIVEISASAKAIERERDMAYEDMAAVSKRFLALAQKADADIAVWRAVVSFLADERMPWVEVKNEAGVVVARGRWATPAEMLRLQAVFSNTERERERDAEHEARLAERREAQRLGLKYLTSAELKIAGEHCDQHAFRRAFGAVMKERAGGRHNSRGSPSMTAPLGPRQIDLLIACCSPDRILLTPDATAESLVKRGLLRRSPGGDAGDIRPSVAISAEGLRAVADLMERGKIEPALKRMKRDVEARRAKAAKRRAQP